LQEMVSFLRLEMIRLPVLWKRSETHQLAEDMLHQARILIAESTQRQDLSHEYQRSMNSYAVNLVTARLSVALHNHHVVELLNTYLPEIGIRHAQIMLFEPEQADPVAWSVVPGLLEDGSLDRRFRSREFPPPGLYENDELLNIILLPLAFQKEVFGYTAFDASNIGYCALIAKQLSATIKASRLHAEVVELSLTDPLTGLHNRRYLDLFLTKEIDRGLRFSHELSIITVDIDHFKEYNDTFGHPAGDQALQQVANCLIKECRTIDVVTRIGGDKFAIILPETDINGALICAEKLWSAIAAISNLNLPIRISLGIAGLRKNIDKPETLLDQADQALYEAKNSGRNRIYIYQEK